MTSTNNNFPKFIHKKINLPKLKRFKDGRGKRYYENESGKKYVSVTTVLDAWPKPWLKTCPNGCFKNGLFFSFFSQL